MQTFEAKSTPIVEPNDCATTQNTGSVQSSFKKLIPASTKDADAIVCAVAADCADWKAA
jgi:hypothetical protein